jgi:hypothetical protein
MGLRGKYQAGGFLGISLRYGGEGRGTGGEE